MCNMIQLKWARGLANLRLSNFLAIILQWTKNMVRDRQSLTEAKCKTERHAPTLFDKHREGEHLSKAMTPRNLAVTIIFKSFVNLIPPTMPSSPHN